jgi:hypothetical protein
MNREARDEYNITIRSPVWLNRAIPHLFGALQGT